MAPVGRRAFVRRSLALATLPATASLTGCEALIRALSEACPENEDESGGVTWTPDVMHPVFYGHQDIDTAAGAPVPLRIWYPSYDGAPDGAPILKLCLVRYPVVLFLHGQEPCVAATDYNRNWFAIPAVLARSGFVVVVPHYSTSLPIAGHPNITMALDTLDWVRDDWSERKWLHARGEATAVAGHSYGALLAGRVVAARPELSAYVGLSGPWDELNDRNAVLGGLTLPKLMAWGRGLFFEDLESTWPALSSPRHAVDFEGEHFDYIADHASCAEPRGPCTALQFGIADLIALFLTRYVPSASSTSIPASLEPPSAPLTVEQQFYAGGRLAGLQNLEASGTCDTRLRWQDGSASGSRTL
jgi:pimeloyl-ACP methyl ester carboxylesterase